MEVTTPNENGPPPPAAEAEQTAADKAARAADAVVEEVAAVSADLTRASDDATRHEVETTRDTLQAGLNTAAQAFECAADQVTKVVGLTGPRAEELARRSSETFEAVAQASAVLARGAQEVSQELLGLAQERSRTAMEGLNRLAACRSVQALVAAQSDLLRDNVALAIHTNQRIAALLVRVADEAAQVLQTQAGETGDRVRRAA
jgi:hypothetical protein